MTDSQAEPDQQSITSGNPAPVFALGIDIGGTKVEGALVDSGGKIHRNLRLPSPNKRRPMLDLLVDMVNRLQGNQTIEGIGFSTPGSLDPKTEILRNAPNSPGLEGTFLRADLEKRLKLPLAFENDANCLTLSEARFGAARGLRHVVGIILGTGVGGGVLLNGRCFQGSRGLAPEIGHTILDVNGRLCLCGNHGCVEAYLSGPSLLRRYWEAGGSREMQQTSTLFSLKKDRIAQKVLAETGGLFARFIAALIAMYDPEAFVLGGGLSNQPFFYGLTSRIADYSFGTNRVPPILRAAGGDASGKLGAACLIFDLFEASPPITLSQNH